MLDGVTGSGKTEVYFEAVADTIRRGRQSLILMPEIALTAQFLDRFAARFGVRPAEWHSELSPRRRARTWRAVADGEVSVVVGARSALFLPYADLGLIVVDEEHDPAYKQEDGVHYHARDMAVVRGHIARIPVVLSSATPSLETEVNARRGRYARLALPERFGGQRMPAVEAIDLRQAPPPRGRFISPVLAGAVKTAHRARRAGAAVSQSPRLCAADLVPRLRLSLLLPELRRLAGRSPLPQAARLPPLRLRHAASGGIARNARPRIPSSPSGRASSASKKRCASLFPEARVLVLSSDLVASVERMREEFADVAAGRFDIVIGTQLVAKGHHFPMLNLVGVIDARSGLEQRRSARRRAHLPAFASGGRPRRPRRRHRPRLSADPPARASGDARADRAGPRGVLRRRDRGRASATHYPPFGRLARSSSPAPTSTTPQGHARALARAAPTHDEVRVLGPAEAPLALVRGRHRLRLLIKAPRNFDLSAYLREWLAAAPKKHGSIKLDIDVDPQSFL